MSEDRAPSSSGIDRLLAIMARLRDPVGGCPWDLAQDFASIAPYTIEEAYEVADAVAGGEIGHLRDELGDLLLQVVFHAQMAREGGHFSFGDVVNAISDKMVKRHPHVFGDADIRTAEAQTTAREAQKSSERAAKAAADGRRDSVLDGVASALPALMRAGKLQSRAARVGFDWPDAGPVFAKIEEELDELKEAIAATDRTDNGKVAEEFGDLLFAMANLARHLEIDAEEALRQGNRKFDRRFRRIEALLAAQGKTPADSDLDEMDRLWDAAKAEEAEK